jgi:Ca-activated chloride channel family protein
MMFTRFTHPYLLLFLLIVPLLVVWYLRRGERQSATLRFSDVGILKRVVSPRAGKSRHLLFVLRMLSLTLLIVAFARPQAGMRGEEVTTEAVDIILAMDVSSSMLAEDIQPNRVEATKEVAKRFIQGRESDRGGRYDRIGLVVFSGEAYTQCPLTLDEGILTTLIDEIRVGMIEDGTAIGMGLATAVNRLRSSKAKSKVVVLLTDGRNNRGEISPVTAAQAAQALDIRIYTIGAGTRGTAMFPIKDLMGTRYVPMQVEIDETGLKKIASLTGGKYFRATDRESLEAIYQEIDAMEKTEIKVEEYREYSELFYFLVGAALIFILTEMVLANTRFRKIP